MTIAQQCPHVAMAKKGNTDSEGAQKKNKNEPTKKMQQMQQFQNTVEDAAAPAESQVSPETDGAAGSAQPPQVGTGDDGERLAAEQEIDRAIRELEDAVEETPPFKPPIITGPDGKFLSDIAIARHEI